MIEERKRQSSYVTPRGMAKIEAQVDYLRTVKRPELVERLHEALGGDWNENTEYMAAEHELAFIDGRIAELEDILRHAELIQPGEVDGIIRLGSTVVVQEADSVLETYTLVGPAEADPAEGLISNASPLGKALLAHTIGDEVEVLAPAGPLRFRIVAVT